MPSLLLPPPRPPPRPPALLNHHHHLHHIPLLLFLLSSFLLFFFLLLFLLFLYKKLPGRHSAAAAFPLHHHPHLRRFSFSHLRRATANFSPSSLLGHGGFGSVHEATASTTTLPSHPSFAVKLMHSPSSPQSSLEFHNELSLSSSLHSPHILSLLGFSASRGGQKLALVYELMANKSLQDALLDRKCEELMEWNRRFEIACDVARGLEYLHHVCDPPVIHGDIKPSNILLDEKFSAKIGDFGLARVKSSEDPAVDNWSIMEETEGGLNQLPESCVIRILDSEPSPEMKESVAESFFDRISVESAKDSIPSGGGGRKNGGSRRDWWWKQDNVGGCGSESGRVKDYVMDWIGSEIKKEEPNSEFVECSISVLNNAKIEEKKKHRKKEKKKNRKPREWWKEEFCEELTKKTKKKKTRGPNSGNGGEMWWQGDMEESKKKKRKPSRSSIDGWLDNFNYEFNKSGDIPKSGGISSTPSLRGTMCYIAPEYGGGGGGGGGQLSEKCDVYSFGVLLLVLVSGRRPLQVTTASPMCEFERANLVSWARQLAYNGKLLELVDPAIHSLDKEQALLCITIALVCLQRSPGKRPSMKEIVGMLLGEAESLALPFEFSPSPTFPFKSRT